MTFPLWPGRRLLAGAVLLAAIAATAPVPPATATASAAPPAADATRAADPGGRVTITLVTGDTVTYGRNAGGVADVTVSPATRSDGSRSDFTTYTREGDTYVVPDDVRPYLRSGVLDEGLFNVTYLAGNGYGDAERADVPLIAQYADRNRRAAAVAGAKVRRQLPSVNGAALAIAKKDGSQFWKALQSAEVPPAEATRRAELRLAGGVGRLWLDRVKHVSLSESVPLVGAPQVWEAGYDGAGVKVAVLDTGVDRTHPDLAGRIAATADFTGTSPEAVDGHGHGTHVASTIAGTGAGSAGKYRGVAPGASLLVGKVCGDDGTCFDSALIAGMQWAAEQDVPVVSISIGGDAPLEYPDLLSRTIDELTASTGTLFVVAAGNEGAKESIQSPGVAASALTVAATDKRDGLAPFSSRGPLWYPERALKPDIAAPGAAIMAARSSASSLPGDLYTSMSGTSMATPHVSGAAALLAQRHPAWKAAQLKAALMGAATDVGLTAYEQGAGRLDVARAVKQQVHAVTPALDLGTLAFDQAPLTRTVTFGNAGPQPVTLTLKPSLTPGSGGEVPAGAITGDTSLTVPAGGTASATVSVNVPALAKGEYTGAVTASDAAGQTVARVPIGFLIEPQSYPVRIDVIGHDGKPCGATDAYGCWSVGALSYLNLDDGRSAFRLGSGSQTVRLTAGQYAFQSSVTWIDADRRQQTAVVLAENVDVRGPVTVTLDASKARRITVETPKPSEGTTNEIGVMRHDGNGSSSGWASLFAYGLDDFWVTPTPKVAKGSLVFQHARDAVAPLLTMEANASLRLDPRYKFYGEAVPKLDGVRSLEVVDLGTIHGLADPASQIPADLGRVKGKLALVEHDDDLHDNQWDCTTPQEYLDALHAAGAAAVILFLKGHMCTADTPLEGVLRPPLPAVTVPPAQGLALRELVKSKGKAVLRVKGQAVSPYLYHLKFYQLDQVGTDQHYEPGTRQLARVDRDYHAEQPLDLTAAWHQWIPGRETVSFAQGFQYRGPSRREEYVGPVIDPGQAVKSFIQRNTLDGAALEAELPLAGVVQRLKAGSRSGEEWYGGPSVPGAFEEEPLYSEMLACGACRQGDVFSPLLPLTFPEAKAESFYTEAVQTGRLHLYKDGAEVPPTPLAGVYTGFTLPAGKARYRLTHELDTVPAELADRFYDRRVSSEWEFTSARVTKDDKSRLDCVGTLVAGSEEPCAVQPLVYLRYDLGLDLGNTTGGGAHRIGLHAYHEAAAGGAPRITSIKAWVSFDGEKTWRAAPASPPSGGTVSALVPAAPARGVPVSLRVRASDAAGNTVTQTVHEAYGVR
ncbi:S8 family peptidase [[Actinomadura] parvosata]|uniref:S8 family peptidase n=1 Tax=[Actinomadura] parvosata TaxID=1955412 RepID=UPI00406D0120